MPKEEEGASPFLDHSFGSESSFISSNNNTGSPNQQSRRVFSDETFHSTRSAPPPPIDTEPKQYSIDTNTTYNDAISDNESFSSVMPTPNLKGDGRFRTSPNPSRGPSLRFKLPDSQSSSSSTPPTTISSSNNNALHHHNKIGSPFMDQNVILENEIYDLKKPQSPFLESFDLPSKSSESDEEYNNASSTYEGNVNRKETVMKRHRWGTTRNKKGRPQKENINRSKTLKGLLRHQSTSKKRSRNDSIRRPNTAESIIDDNDSDEESLTSPKVNDPNDRKYEKRSFVFNKQLPDEYLDSETGEPNTNYPRNKIRTTKYTPLSFIPKNITNQFLHNVANIYFLILIILGAFDIFGVPSPVLAAVPLIVIVIITAIKDAIEDSRRTVTDLEVNNQTTHILTQNPNSNSDYVYTNYNINDENISLWRKFKKLNSRLLFKLVGKAKSDLTKEGRAIKAREKFNREHNINPDNNQRKSFESDCFDVSPRNSSENPFNDQLRKSFQQQRRESHYNYQKTLKFAKKFWKDAKVGDIIRVYNNDEIPADLIILATSDEDNCCYVETKNLDGETNLKIKQALKYSSIENQIKRADDLINHQFQIDSEGPHANLYSYQGNLRYYEGNEEKQESITINNLLLRGCSLRNTKWVIGIVAFTGDDTKIMLNAGITPTKQSRISRELNYYVFLNFVLLFIICFVSGLVNGIWYRESNVSRNYFEFGTIAGSPFKNGIVGFFVALILYQSLVPISLYITIEIIKTAQAFFIYSDISMYYERLDYPCTPKSWSISDDLGQIEYVFSDKTGTLTQNLMEFKKCTVNGISYGRAYTEALAGLRKRQGIDVESEAIIEKELIAKDRVEMIEKLRKISKSSCKYVDDLTFISSDFVDDLNGTKGDNQKKCNEHFMLALALCHSVLAEPDPKNPSKLLLKAQSPDEAALVDTARSVGYGFNGNTKKGVLVDIQGASKEFQILNTLEFNSTRKRMSAIIKIPPETPDQEPKALLICKGADSIIYSRLSKSQNDKDLLEATSKHLEEYATEGLRTLCIAQRELSWKQYTEWNRRHQAAASSIDDREAKMEAVADSIERELILLGGTAIEDRLQDGVPDSIALLGQAGIKLWVLTGDKVETAINIGFSCNLLGNDMEILILKTEFSKDELATFNIDEDLSENKLINHLISQYLLKYFNMTGSVEELESSIGDHHPPNEGFGVVIDGDALKLAFLDPDTKRKFLLLCKQCKAVLCCRVSPAQKAAVVKLVKDTLDVMTLAIGDGSNDVAMIQAADVGVGIAGEEGRQAVMSSDYAVGQFRYLARLLLVHGRWSYKRFSEMIPSFFFKNVIFSIALFWYGIYNNFDGSYLFEFTYLMFYNLAFTSLPVIFLGVFDQDVSAKVSLIVPQLYRSGISRSEFTETKFWWYMIDAIYQSVISFFFPYLMYYTSFQSMNGLSIDHRFWIGIVVTCISCISCNLYILLHQYRWDWCSGLFVALSILVIYAWTGIWTASTYAEEFYKAAPQIFGAAGFWACSFIGVLSCLVPRFFYDFVQKLFWPKDIDIIRECAARGDFDVYPENYDPTDPNRQKISQYSNDHIKRISMSNSTNNSPEYHKNITSTSSGSSDLEQQTNTSAQASSNKPIITPTYPQANGHESKLDSQLQNRKSVLDLFKRKSKAASSYYDNSSLIDTYNLSNVTTEDLANSIRTEEIAMEDFSVNRNRASRISSEIRKFEK